MGCSTTVWPGPLRPRTCLFLVHSLLKLAGCSSCSSAFLVVALSWVGAPNQSAGLTLVYSRVKTALGRHPVGCAGPSKIKTQARKLWPGPAKGLRGVWGCVCRECCFANLVCGVLGCVRTFGWGLWQAAFCCGAAEWAVLHVSLSRRAWQQR